jgi:hypothetical protein
MTWLSIASDEFPEASLDYIAQLVNHQCRSFWNKTKKIYDSPSPRSIIRLHIELGALEVQNVY